MPVKTRGRLTLGLVLVATVVLALVAPAFAWSQVTFRSDPTTANVWIYTSSYSAREGGNAQSTISGNQVWFRSTSSGGGSVFYESTSIQNTDLSHPSRSASSRCKQNPYGAATLTCYYKKT